MLEETICALGIKGTKLNNLRVIKEKSAYFATCRDCCGVSGRCRGAGIRIISRTTNRSYAIQGYSLCLIMNYYYYKKNSHE